MGFLSSRAVRRTVLPVALLIPLVAGCGGSGDDARPGRISSAPSVPPTSAPPATSAAPAASGTPGPTASGPVSPTTGPEPSRAPDIGTNGATPAPAWLGTRVLPRGSDGFGVAPATPAELRDRRIITEDRLAPPPDGRFRSQITAVPAAVAERSTWTSKCPVKLRDLRYVTVSFLGFDGRPHTGELLLHRTAADDVVSAFEQLYTVGWPIEEMRITGPADMTAPPTGDGNDTSAFVCRPVRGASSWSQHAYGLAIDLNPFHNPYVDGRTVLPELATSYTDRNQRLAGMNTPGTPPTKAFAAIGWGWGGDYSSKKDWMHFSANGK